MESKFQICLASYYQLVRQGSASGVAVDGRVTQSAIERAVGGTFAISTGLCDLLRSRLLSRFGMQTVSDINTDNWRFLSLRNESRQVWSVESVSVFVESAPTAEKTARIRNVTAVSVDWAAHDAANRALGQAGEEFVADYERRVLLGAGRADLARLVDIKARSEGDGLGYDVLSFTPAGEEKFIEVKTTTGNKHAAFFITANELRVARTYGRQYWLYRVFGDSERRRLYMMQGPLEDIVELEPEVFRAKCRTHHRADA